MKEEIKKPDSGLIDNLIGAALHRLGYGPTAEYEDPLAGSIMLEPVALRDAPGVDVPVESPLGVMDFTSAGDVIAGAEAIKNRDLLGAALAALSLGIPGTIKIPKEARQALDMSTEARMARATEQGGLTYGRLRAAIKDQLGIDDTMVGYLERAKDEAAALRVKAEQLMTDHAITYNAVRDRLLTGDKSVFNEIRQGLVDSGKGPKAFQFGDLERLENYIDEWRKEYKGGLLGPPPYSVKLEIDSMLSYHPELAQKVQAVTQASMDAQAATRALEGFEGTKEAWRRIADKPENDLVNLYHGSTTYLEEGFGADYRGLGAGGQSAKIANFATVAPDEAGTYAQAAATWGELGRNPRLSRANQDMKPLQEAYDKAAALEAAAAWDDPTLNTLRANTRAAWDAKQALEQEIEARYLSGEFFDRPNIVPLNVKTINPKIVNKQNTGMGDITKNIKKAKAEGYDSVVFFDIKDPLEHSIHFAGFEPNQFRAPWAAYDPAKRDSSDLLAGIAPWLLAGAAVDQLVAPKE